MRVLTKVVRELRWSILGFGGTAALMAVIVTAIFPSIRDTLGDIDLPAELGTFVGLEAIDYANPRHYLSGEFFSWIPLLLVIMAIRASTGQLAGEEDAGTIELLLAQPITRRRLFAQTWAGLTVGFAAAACLTVLGFAAIWPFVEMDGVSLARTIGVTALMLPLLVAVGALTLLAGALARTKGQAQAIAIGVTVLAYVFLFLSRLHGDLEPLQFLSAFYYAGTSTALIEGVPVWRVGTLVASAVLLTVTAGWAFEARDIGTGRSPLPRMAAQLRRASRWGPRALAR